MAMKGSSETILCISHLCFEKLICVSVCLYRSSCSANWRHAVDLDDESSGA
jgi:hypothetical protein